MDVLKLDMRHSAQELFEIIYQYYPRKRAPYQPGYKKTKEYRRRLEACRSAIAYYEQWVEMIRRLAIRFPEATAHNFSMYIKAPGSDIPEYTGMLTIPNLIKQKNHSIDFAVSILAPYYKIYSTYSVDDLTTANPPRYKLLSVGRRCYAFPIETSIAEMEAKTGLSNLETYMREDRIRDPNPTEPKTMNIVRFDLSPDEELYSSEIIREIEAAFPGYELMPPEVGKMIVPDIATAGHLFGEATVYACLMSDIE